MADDRPYQRFAAGTGDLQGMTIFLSNPGDIAIDAADNPCSDVPFAVLIEGEILAPRGTSQ